MSQHDIASIEIGLCKQCPSQHWIKRACKYLRHIGFRGIFQSLFVAEILPFGTREGYDAPPWHELARKSDQEFGNKLSVILLKIRFDAMIEKFIETFSEIVECTTRIGPDPDPF